MARLENKIIITNISPFSYLCRINIKYILPQKTLDIPKNKLQFFMELIESLDFVHLEQIDDVPEEHKRIVLERIRKSEKKLTGY